MTRTDAIAALLLLLTAGGYLLTCRIWPYGNCRRCHGTGKSYALIGPGFRHCPRCKATGYRLRIGRRLLNRLNGTRQDAK